MTSGLAAIVTFSQDISAHFDISGAVSILREQIIIHSDSGGALL